MERLWLVAVPMDIRCPHCGNEDDLMVGAPLTVQGGRMVCGNSKCLLTFTLHIKDMGYEYKVRA